MPFNRHGVEVGVFVGIANLLIYTHFTPPVSDVTAAPPYDANVEKGEQKALIAAVALTGVTAIAVRSWDTFLIGGTAIIVADFAIKHANAVFPETGKMTPPGGSQALAQQGNGGSVYQMPDYAVTGTEG